MCVCLHASMIEYCYAKPLNINAHAALATYTNVFYMDTCIYLVNCCAHMFVCLVCYALKEVLLFASDISFPTSDVKMHSSVYRFILFFVFQLQKSIDFFLSSSNINNVCTGNRLVEASASSVQMCKSFGNHQIEEERMNSFGIEIDLKTNCFVKNVWFAARILHVICL